MLEIKIFFVIEKVNMAHYSHTGKKAKKKEIGLLIKLLKMRKWLFTE